MNADFGKQIAEKGLQSFQGISTRAKGVPHSEQIIIHLPLMEIQARNGTHQQRLVLIIMQV